MIIGSNLLFHATLSSTNTEATVLLRSGDQPEGTAIYTDFQTAGKGQAGNKWESEKGKNLLFSVILYPQSISPIDQYLISMSISLGICDFLDRHCAGAKIKWPNDIFLKDDKIAGVLIENSIIGTIIEYTIAGIGLNLNQEDFEGIFPRPISLKMAAGKEFDKLACLKELLHDLDIRYKQLLYGDSDLIKSDYLSRLYRIGEWHSFKSSGAQFTGRIIDVLISGQIRIEQKEGGTREFYFKEFSYLS
jgi:BirA family biotin operon repressor/biotin-[acetyl-CoA-carboxylase] ligase